jgi:hypothetical protein
MRTTMRWVARTVAAWLLLACAVTTFAVSGVRAEKKTTPERVYVVTSGHQTDLGRVLVIDPDAGKVIEGYAKGYRADVVLSADGDKLFVTYDRQFAQGGSLEVLDASSGQMLFRRDEDRARGAGAGGYNSRLTLSRDGTWLYRYKRTFSLTDGASEWIETFDTTRNVMLPETVRLPLCGEPTLLPGTQRESLFIVCPESQDVRVVMVTSAGASTSRRPARLNLGGAMRLGVTLPVFFGPSEQLTVIKTNGAYARVDAASSQISEKDAIDRTARRVAVPEERAVPAPAPATPAAESPNTSDWLTGRAISHSAVLSPDRSILYAIVSRRPPSTPAEIVALDAQRLERIRSIPLRSGVGRFTISRDGSRLYAVDAARDALVIIDAVSGAELRVIPNVGPEPMFAVAGS